MFLPIFVLSSFVTAGSCMFFENLSPKARCRSIFLGSKWEWLPIFFVPLQSTMTRVFHHRLTLGELCGILLLALASLYCFWFGTWPMAVLGALLVAVAVRGIDRGIHTDYVLDDDQTDHAERQDRAPTRTGHPLADHHGASPYAPPPAHGQLCDGGAWRPQHQYLHPGERSFVCRGSRQACLSCQEHLQRKRNRILILRT